MQYPKYLVLGFIALTLAGCGTVKAPETVKTQPNPQAAEQKPAVLPAQTATVVTPAPQPAASDSTTTTAAATTVSTTPTASASTMKFEVDETWQTYANKALSFEFQWPTRGTYAPHWSVDFFKPSDTSLKDGCVNNGSDEQHPYYKEFCHTTSYIENGGNYRADYFTIKNGNQYVVIRFQKDLFTMSDNCKTKGLTTSANSCKEFNPEDYQTLLETIMSTFKYTN